MSDGFDGPTINGRPILTIEEVQEWFRAACGKVPSSETAANIARTINELDFISAHWRSDFREDRNKNPDTLRLKRISAALKTLQSDLPVKIADTLRVFPGAAGGNQRTGIIELLNVVNAVAPAFAKFGPRGRGGRNREPWHNVARNLRPLISAAFESAGIRRAGFGRATSPGIKILSSALGRLNVNVDHETIVDALRGARERKKTKTGK